MKKIILTLFLISAIPVFAQQVALDPEFITGTGPDQTVTNVKQLPDGKILIAGDFFNYNGTAAGRIARLNADGSIDETFTLNLGSPVEATFVDENGKFIATQQFGGPLRRYNSDGGIDADFNTPSFSGNGPYRIAKQGDKYIVAGDFDVYSSTGVQYTDIARLNADGTLDITFNQTRLFDNSYVNMLVQPDGKIMIMGAFAYFNTDAVPNIIRLNENGSLDPTFNAGTGAAGAIRAIAMQPDGKYIISGTFESFNGVAKHLNTRLNSDGSLDNTFNYTTTVGLPEDGVVGYKIFVQPNGKILIGGAFKDAMQDIEGTPDGSVPVYLTLLNTDGSTDDSFTAPFDDSVFSFDVQDDGKLLVGGWFRNYNGQPQKSLARLNYNALSTPVFNKSAFTVYPNPVSGQLNIDLNNESSVNAVVTILDVLGKQVYNAIHNDINMTIDMSGYNNGIYFLRLQSSGNVYTKKIIKN
jgi:uncharacterized delta-60 repeat protein